MIERGTELRQFSGNFPAIFDFFMISKSVFDPFEKDVKMFFTKSKKGFLKIQNLENCRKVAGKLP